MSKFFRAAIACGILFFGSSAIAERNVIVEGYCVPLFMVEYIPSDCEGRVTQRVEYNVVWSNGTKCKIPDCVYRTGEYTPTCVPSRCKPCFNERRECDHSRVFYEYYSQQPIYQERCEDHFNERCHDRCYHKKCHHHCDLPNPCEIVCGLAEGGAYLTGKIFEGIGCVAGGIGEVAGSFADECGSFCCNPCSDPCYH